MSENIPSDGGIAKPRACPFCGFSMTSVDHARDRGVVHHFVLCGDCGAQGPWADHAASAITIWNKRERDKLSRRRGVQGMSIKRTSDEGAHHKDKPKWN